MVLSPPLMNCFPKYIHLRNLFAGEPGGFQRLLRPICSAASQPGDLSFPAAALKAELTGKRSGVVHQTSKASEGHVRHLRAVSPVTVSLSESNSVSVAGCPQ